MFDIKSVALAGLIYFSKLINILTLFRLFWGDFGADLELQCANHTCFTVAFVFFYLQKHWQIYTLRPRQAFPGAYIAYRKISHCIAVIRSNNLNNL